MSFILCTFLAYIQFLMKYGKSKNMSTTWTQILYINNFSSFFRISFPTHIFPQCRHTSNFFMFTVEFDIWCVYIKRFKTRRDAWMEHDEWWNGFRVWNRLEPYPKINYLIFTRKVFVARLYGIMLLTEISTEYTFCTLINMVM